MDHSDDIEGSDIFSHLLGDGTYPVDETNETAYVFADNDTGC